MDTKVIIPLYPTSLIKCTRVRQVRYERTYHNMRAQCARLNTGLSKTENESLIRTL